MTTYLRKGVEVVLREARVAPEQRKARRLRDDGMPLPESGDHRRVMIVSPRDWAAHVHYEGIIAQALRLRGADVRFLTCGGGLEVCDRANVYEAPPMPCRSCSKYVETSIAAHGFRLDLMRDEWSSTTASDWPELDLLPAAELPAVVDQGLPLGQLVDIPLKWFLCSANLDDDPLAPVLYRAFLRSSRRIAAAVGTALERSRPDVVLLLNGLFLFEGIANALCQQRGIDVVTYERAFRKETLVFSRGQPAGFYDFSDRWEPGGPALTAAEDAELESYLSDRRSGRAFDQYWEFEPGAVPAGNGRLVTLFTNLTWDTAVIGRDLAFVDIRAWLNACIEAFACRPEHRLVIRVHPSETRLPGKSTRDSLEGYLLDRYPDLPGNIKLVAGSDLRSSYDLIGASDFGIVYTSTAGMELALAGKPVIVCGSVHYRGKGFTLDASSPAQFQVFLDACLLDASGLAPDRAMVRRYAHLFFFSGPRHLTGVVEPIPGLVRITVEGLDELLPGRDRDLDAICRFVLDGPGAVDDRNLEAPASCHG